MLEMKYTILTTWLFFFLLSLVGKSPFSVLDLAIISFIFSFVIFSGGIVFIILSIKKIK